MVFYNIALQTGNIVGLSNKGAEREIFLLQYF